MLVARFPAIRHKGKQFSVDLSYLLAAPHLAIPFGESYLNELVADTDDVSTLYAMSKRLRNGFFAYLRDAGLRELQLSEIDSAVSNGFIRWLNQKASANASAKAGKNVSAKTGKRTGKEEGKEARWAETTRLIFYKAFVRALTWISSAAAWAASVKEGLVLKSNPWPGASTRSNSKRVINADLMTRIRLACMSEVKEYKDKFEETLSIITSTGELKSLGDLDQVELLDMPLEDVLCYVAREVERNHTLRICDLPEKLAAAIERKGLVLIEDIAPRFYPTARALVPVVLLMAIALSYNADTTRKATLDDFHYSDTLGRFLVHRNSGSDGDGPGSASNDSKDEAIDEFVASAKKGRSRRKTQKVFIPVDDGIDNPAVLYEFTKSWTASIRKVAPAMVARHLFIFSTQKQRAGVVTYHGFDGITNASTWGTELAKFRDDHQLEYFALEEIRPTVLDIAFQISGGDVRVVQIQANHQSSDTTYDSYTSDAEKQRGQERLGKVSLMRDRWRETQGVIDSRDLDKQLDVNCATPGWRCLDPYDSPFTAKGKLCSGYGHCPNCPLGSINLRSPLSCAYAFALLDAINRSQLTMPPEGWIARIAPIKEKIMKRWLPSFPPAVIEKAKGIDIPQLPVLE